MRPTRNISEYTCPDIDCDQLKAEKSFQKSVREMARRLRQRGIYDPSKQGVTLDDIDNSSVYDHSPFFDSMRYLNNIHVDDLLDRLYEQERVYKVVGEAESQLYYYLRGVNFNFLSIFDEKVHKVNISKCEDKFPTLTSIQPCLEEVHDYKLAWKDFYSKRGVDVLKTDFNELISNFRISKPLAREICFHFAKQALYPDGGGIDMSDEGFLGGFIGGSFAKVWSVIEKYGPLRRWHSACQSQLSLTTEQIDACKSDYSTKRERLLCESRQRSKNREGPLNIERKIRVKDTGRYFPKGGKTQNINIGASFSLNYNHSFGHSWSPIRVGSGAGIMSLAARSLRGSNFEGIMNIASSDYRIGGSKVNSQGNSITVTEQTFLVMQDAAMDIELTDYVKCASIYPNFFYVDKDELSDELSAILGKRVDRKLKKGGMPLSRPEDLNKGGVQLFSEDDYEREWRRISLKVKRGLLICSSKEINGEYFKPMAIHENYYYFTQHFTEGDLLDPADLYNHPWLKKIRGKTDVWRFLDRIKANEDNLSGGFLGMQPRGPIVEGNIWPIHKLISVYSGVVPSFPGIYTMLHNEYEYEANFPWSNQPAESFEESFLNRIAGVGWKGEEKGDGKKTTGTQRKAKLRTKAKPQFNSKRGWNRTKEWDSKRQRENARRK